MTAYILHVLLTVTKPQEDGREFVLTSTDRAIPFECDSEAPDVLGKAAVEAMRTADSKGTA